jgi:hypothetical protein
MTRFSEPDTMLPVAPSEMQSDILAANVIFCAGIDMLGCNMRLTGLGFLTMTACRC